jgi:regulator of protease activity HflC (stomatin/prohibitin superfamily)
LNNKKKPSKKLLWIPVGFIILILLSFSFYTVSAGERGVLLTWGKPSMDAKGEGLHVKIPFVQSIKKMEVRTQKIETNADSASRDLQDVQTTIALNFHLMPESTPNLYQEVGFTYRERIIDPAIQESVKSISAQFTAEELITKRPEVRLGIQDSISERLGKYYIVVDDFNIINFQFSEEFDKAIEEKVTAEQRKLKAERDLERIKIEAEQVKTQAEAEAQALTMKAEAIKKSDEVVSLKQIEIQEKAIEKWNGNLPKVTGGAIPFIDLRGGVNGTG